MNNTEEQLWSYIDGTCSTTEHQAITLLIEQNDNYRSRYNELLLLNAEFAAMELDEPPMAFTYKVMEGIRTEEARQPLKAAINQRIIYGIAGFFILTILALLAFALSNVQWSAVNNGIKIPEQININQVKNIFTGPLMQGFLFFDLVLGLYLLDDYLRKKQVLKNQ